MSDLAQILGPETIANAKHPGLLRRLAAITYDLVLVASVLIVAAALYVIPYIGITGNQNIQGLGRLAFQVYLVAVIALYYVYFWSGGRQTLGMRSWRIRVLRDDGADLRTLDALRRLGLAIVTLLPLGVGLLWMLIDRNGLAWYDRLSRTRLVLTARRR